MSDTKQKPKRRRRWYRYSLRSLLVVVTILCVALAYWTHRANRQKAVVKWVEENGGYVRYDFEYDEKDKFIVYSTGPDQICLIEDAKPPYPEWLRAFLGDDYLATVVYVDLKYRNVKDVAPLAQLKQLEYLYLDKTQVSDLTPLAGLTRLEVLRLEDTQVSDLAPLARLTRLEMLLLEETQVSDLTPLAGLTNLKHLSLADTVVSDLTPLARLTRLVGLDLDFTQVSDLTPLAGLTRLDSLCLYGTQVSDLTPLMKLKSLTNLLPRKTQVTQEQIDLLQNALPNCYIEWSPPDKTIEGN